MAPAAQFVASTLLTAALALAGIGAFNAWIDPFMQYRMPSYPARYSSGFARHINAGLIRNLDFDSVILGSSYVVNFRNSDFDRVFGGRAVSLAMPGMYASESHKVLAYAFNRKPLKRVFFGLDYFAFDETENIYPFPDYLYDESWMSDAPYLLSLDTTKRSLNIVLDRAPDSFSTDPDMPWTWWRSGMTFSREKALTDYENKKKSGINRKPVPLSGMQRTAREQLVDLLVRHPDTEFEFFLPPYSALTWILNARNGNLAPLLQFRAYLSQLLAQYPNARLHDFQAMRSVVCDLDRYGDIGHYGPDENRMMVAAMRGGKYLVEPESIRLNNAVIEDIVRGRCSGTIESP